MVQDEPTKFKNALLSLKNRQGQRVGGGLSKQRKKWKGEVGKRGQSR